MKTLTIAASFRLRNKLKERIKKLGRQINHAKAFRDADEPENTAIFDGRTFHETIEATAALMDALRKLNFAIEKANAVNKEDLIALETLKAKIALYDVVAGKCREVEKKRYELVDIGAKQRIELEPVLDQARIVAQLDALKKSKDEIEERLTERNLKTPVEFDAEEARKLL